jgi:hypothetical protein
MNVLFYNGYVNLGAGKSGCLLYCDSYRTAASTHFKHECVRSHEIKHTKKVIFNRVIDPARLIVGIGKRSAAHARPCYPIVIRGLERRASKQNNSIDQ